MNIVFQGQRIRRSTGHRNRALADAIMAKVKVQLIEGQYFRPGGGTVSEPSRN